MKPLSIGACTIVRGNHFTKFIMRLHQQYTELVSSEVEVFSSETAEAVKSPFNRSGRSTSLKKGSSDSFIPSKTS